MVFLIGTATSLTAESKGRAIGFLFLKKPLLYSYFDCLGPIFIGRATV